MARIGICGGTYTSESVNADFQITLNWYPEIMETSEAVSAVTLYPCPGVVQFALLPEGPVRGILYTQTTAGPHCYAVGGSKLCEVAADGTVTVLGSLSNNGPRPAQMVTNNAGQLLVCDGKNLFCYQMFLPPQASATIAQIKVTNQESLFEQQPGQLLIHPQPFLELIFTANNPPFQNGTALVLAGLTAHSTLNGATINQTTGTSGLSMFRFVTVPGSIPANDAAFLTETGTATLSTYGGPAFQQVAVGMGPFTHIAYLDGWFIALQENSQNYYLSSLLNGLQWGTATDGGTVNQAQVSLFQDNVLGMIQDHEVLTLFGLKETVTYYDAGGDLFPFAPVQGSPIDQGAVTSPTNDNYTMTCLDNRVFWLGANEHGRLSAWRLDGYTPTRISTSAIENQWRQYPNGGSDAIGFAYGENGHAFYHLYFPSANQTWVYDTLTNMWHQRASHSATNPGAGYHTWDARCQAFAFNKQLMGSTNSGVIWWQDKSLFNDAYGTPMVRVRRAPHATKEQEMQWHHKLRLHLESGLGPVQPLPGFAVGDPFVVLQDAAGVNWQITINDNGNAAATSLGPGPAPAPILLVDIGLYPYQVVCYTLGIGVGGAPLLVIPPAPPPALPISSGFKKRVPLMTQPGGLQTFASVQFGALVIDPPTQPIREPEVQLRWSDDGGHNWSDPYICGAGMSGDFQRIVEWRGLGRTRDRIYEIRVTDPIPWRIIDAYLTATPDFQPSERYLKQVSKIT